MKSLVVDDDFTCAYIYKTLLSNYGSCESLANGPDAIEAYKTSLDKGNPYDLIILDIMMPDMNGYEVLKNIRLLEEKRQLSFPFVVKIILATSLDDIENRQYEQKLDNFIEAYLVKSNNPNDLLDKLNLLGFDVSEPV